MAATFFSVLSLATAAAASSVLQLNGTSYYTPDLVEATLEGDALVQKTTPFTFLEFADAACSEADVSALVGNFLTKDDVFTEPFLATVLLSTESGAPVELAEDAKSYLEQSAVLHGSLNGTLRPGPYFLHPDGTITKAYRLYADPNFAFVESVTAGEDGAYVPVTGSTGDRANGGVSVAVPSRLYYPPPSEERPLEGKRLGVKDIFDIKGIRTSAGSRSYFALDKIASETAPSLQALVDLGAVLVGKTKTTQFALGEAPTVDYVDQLAPFNPRGDGYQNPQGSSSGTGAGVASYEWLDFGTGSDTGGSVRLPSMQNGLFGMRTSSQALPVDGIAPITPVFDTPGLLARSASLLKTAYGAWLPAAPYSSYPKRILLPEEFWPPVNATSSANETFSTFLNSLSDFLSAPLESIGQNDSFIAHTGHPAGVSWLSNSYSNITKYDQVRLVRDPLVAEYQAKYDGAYPFFNPVAMVEWAWGEQVTPEGYESARSRVKTYEEWFRSQLVPTCEEAIVVYPMGAGNPLYRNVYRAPPTLFAGAYSGNLQAVYAGCPDITVPIGTNTYNSTISKRVEELPVTVGIIAGAGCDTMLTDLVAELAEKGVIVGEVKTGKTLY
ncbi:uncharacterized protein HMPREF1541_04045 [Cyphellophora europaea CBS 101466]|uniref:Uncharacterized protein n=1 Tax=Cyphellophora europaea (strain CBS 101466) TaxID=1220924 RepID=W2S041_CYPE1|nr:uncharacterized protein HMPREF1541_04045 [Cyphellophora europaea CBS 101466]ETN42106.1 hypothetical protein HMPREF1541_04045 [Cyphellophora europaea CBS 101466]